jgi:competence protein ComFC
MWFKKMTRLLCVRFIDWIDTSVKQLLQPMSDVCFICNRSHQGFSGYEPVASDQPIEPIPGLCGDCYQSIPWIDDVKCKTCGRADACTDCTRRSCTYFTANRSAVRYQPNMKEWLARYKYRGDERFNEIFASMLKKNFKAWNVQLSIDSSAFVCFTYVPLSQNRLETRGFNQAEQLARLLGAQLNVPVLPLLKRKVDTAKQSYKTRQERLADLDHVFEMDYSGVRLLEQNMSSGMRHKEITVWIIDDVYTTGSTLNQCAKIITNKLKCRVLGLCWAR